MTSQDIPLFMLEPYTIQDLAKEMKAAANNGCQIEYLSPYAVNRLKAQIKEDKVIRREYLVNTNIFSIARLNTGFHPVGCEHLDISQILMRVIEECDDMFTKEEMECLLKNIVEETERDERLDKVMKKYKQVAAIDPYRENFTLKELTDSFRVFLKGAKELKSDDTAAIIEHIIGAKIKNITQMKKAGILKYVFFLNGFLPNNYSDEQEITKKLMVISKQVDNAQNSKTVKAANK